LILQAADFTFARIVLRFARAVILLSARGAARLWRAKILRVSEAPRFYVLRSAVLQTGGASAVFAGRDFKLAVRRSFQTATL